MISPLPRYEYLKRVYEEKRVDQDTGDYTPVLLSSSDVGFLLSFTNSLRWGVGDKVNIAMMWTEAWIELNNLLLISFYLFYLIHFPHSLQSTYYNYNKIHLSQQLGCIHVLSLLTESFPVANYPGAWGCSVSLSCRSPLPTQPIGPFSSPSRPSSPSAACTGGGGPLSVVVGSMISSGLAYDLFAHQQLLQVSVHENF